MAGIAALMRTRKERERKRLGSIQLDETGFSEVIPGKEQREGASTPGATSQKSQSSLKKSDSIIKKKAEKQLEISINNAKLREQRILENVLRESYTPVYIGFVFISIGLVITFVGLGDKGFRTVELKLIGPTLCIFGLSCILFKIIQCHFPRLCLIPRWVKLKKARLADTESSNMVEKGIKNGHLGDTSKVASPQNPVFSPRVILQSTEKIPRPKSTIPNYIEDSSDDDFDTGHHRPRPPNVTQTQSCDDGRNNEIILNPRTLML